MEQESRQSILGKQFVSELIGTALLVLVGLSFVIFMFGIGSPMARLIPNEGIRRLITGFLFGTTGASIALSPVGKVSGAHINPVVTLAFRLMGKLDARTTLVYVMAQLIGAVVGSLPLLLWGAMGKSIDFGATFPGTGIGISTALFGEIATTFTMVALLVVFLGFRKIRPFTPAIFPPLYSIMVWAESPISDKAVQMSYSGASGASLHAKAFTVDSQGLFIGSFNLDPRSAEWNAEMGVYVKQPELAQQFESLFAIGTDASVAWRVALVEGDLNWSAGTEVFDHEPMASRGRRFKAWLARVLPINTML